LKIGARTLRGEQTQEQVTGGEKREKTSVTSKSESCSSQKPGIEGELRSFSAHLNPIGENYPVIVIVTAASIESASCRAQGGREN